MLRIREIREARGLTQSELSKLSGVKQQTISMQETGERIMPRLDTAAKIAAALGCTLDDLLEDSELRQNQTQGQDGKDDEQCLDT